MHSHTKRKMKECNFLQTYEIFLRMMYISLLKEFYMQMEYDARGNVTEYIDGRKTKFVREYTKTDLLKSEEVFNVKEDDNNYKSTPDASRSYAYDNLNRITSVLLCLK